MELQLEGQKYDSIKKAFFNIFSYFLIEEPDSKEFHDCVYKWGIQLGVGEEILDFFVSERAVTAQFKMPENKLKALEQIYDLVYMIYLDDIVEDTELLVASKFAEKIGVERHVVGEILKAIITAPDDGSDDEEIRENLIDFLDSSQD